MYAVPNPFAILPGWGSAAIMKLACAGPSSSLHTEACKAWGVPDGDIHSNIYLAALRFRANAWCIILAHLSYILLL